MKSISLHGSIYLGSECKIPRNLCLDEFSHVFQILQDIEAIKKFVSKFPTSPLNCVFSPAYKPDQPFLKICSIFVFFGDSRFFNFLVAKSQTLENANI